VQATVSTAKVWFLLFFYRQITNVSSYQPAHWYERLFIDAYKIKLKVRGLELLVAWQSKRKTKGSRVGVACGLAVEAGEKNSRIGSVSPNLISLRGQYKCTIQMEQVNQNQNQNHEFR